MSSSAHLIIVPFLFGWDDTFIDSLEFGVMLDLGTLAALLIYYGRDWLRSCPRAARPSGIARSTTIRPTPGLAHRRGHDPGSDRRGRVQRRHRDLVPGDRPGRGDAASSVRSSCGWPTAGAGPRATWNRSRCRSRPASAWPRCSRSCPGSADPASPSRPADWPVSIDRPPRDALPDGTRSPPAPSSSRPASSSPARRVSHAAGPLIVGLIASFVSGLIAIRFLMEYVRTRSLDIFVVYAWAWRPWSSWSGWRGSGAPRWKS